MQEILKILLYRTYKIIYHVTNYKKKKKYIYIYIYICSLSSPITFINKSICMLYVKKKNDSTCSIL